jgi:GNAT superfamily N-acetyltransferase
LLGRAGMALCRGGRPWRAAAAAILRMLRHRRLRPFGYARLAWVGAAIRMSPVAEREVQPTTLIGVHRSLRRRSLGRRLLGRTRSRRWSTRCERVRCVCLTLADHRAAKPVPVTGTNLEPSIATWRVRFGGV